MHIKIKAFLHILIIFAVFFLSDSFSDIAFQIFDGGIRIDINHNYVILHEKEISLTEMEYKILLLMMKYPQKIFSIQNLYESVWEEPFAYASSNTVMVHIRKLRKKIEENPQKPKIIETVWGKGYRFGK